MANIAEQMEVFGYTPEGLDQEVEKYAGEAKKDFAESKLEEERRANHPLNSVAPFQRIAGASTDDIEIPNSDPGVRTFKTKLGTTYNISVDRISTYEAEREKLRENIINSIEGIKGYLEDPSLPSKEQVVDFIKGAAVGTLEQIKKSMSSGATYGDIFGTVAGVGAASTPFKVLSEPDSTTLRIFGGRGSKSGQKDYSKEFEALRLKKEKASPEEIEAATGRVETAPPSSYVNSLQPTIRGPVFKFEIDDSQVKINGSYKTAYGTRSVRDASLKKPAFLEQVINHPVLFDEYPDLRDVRFVFDNIKEKNGNLGHYDPNQNAIVLDNKYKNMSFNSAEFREIFFHELQHAAQALDYRHGFLEMLGANPAEIKRLLANTGQQLQDTDPYNYANLLKNKKIIKYRNDIINFYNKNKEALDNKSNPKLVNKFAKMFYFLDQEVYKEYLKSGIEVEARVAGIRAKNLGEKPTESASSAIARESDFTSFKKRLKDLTQVAGTKFNFMLSTGGEKFTNTYYKDAMNFARYATGQDKDFNTGSDPNVSPMAGFTGDNPPTYERRPPKINFDLKNINDLLKMRQDDIRNNRIPGLTREQETEIYNKHYSRPDYLNPDVTWASTAREYGIPVSRVQKAANRINMVNRLLIQRSIATQKKVEPDDKINLEAAVSDEIFFRMPVIEFVRNLDIPKKGILGSNFLKLVEKNPSIADSSFLRQKESINPTKRYSKKELQETLIENSEFFTAGKVKSGGSQFDRYQRQKLIGFRGGSEREYFEIPIRSFKSASPGVLPGEKLSFRPKRGTHFGDSAIAHVRGSIIKRKIKPGATDTEKNLNEGVNSGFNEAPEFSKIIGDQPFLLAEEIQSNLVKGGFLKTNFDEIYDEAVANFDRSHGERAYISMATGLGGSAKAGDKKFRDLIKELDEENRILPASLKEDYGIQFGLEGEKLEKYPVLADGTGFQNDGPYEFVYGDYLRDKLEDKGFFEGLSGREWIDVRAKFRHLYGNYRKRISERTRFQSTGNVKKALEEYDSPPIIKTKQAVEESLKALIAKAAMENVNYIVFPNVARIKMARNKEFDPGDKSDMFYKMYFKELNEALVDLEKNYPVEIYSIDLPYDDKAFLTTPTSMLTAEVPDLYLTTFRKFVESNSPKLTNEVIPSNGTVLDVTELVKKFKAENPRQFAEGGDTVRPEPKPDTRPFPDVKPKIRPEGRSEFITRGYEIDGREVQVGIIKFKGGEEIALDKVLDTIDQRNTANEPVITKNTVTQVLNFIEKNNPTREEFETYWYNKRLNKGGMMGDQMQMAFMNEGGLTDDGMDIDPVSGNDIPSGSMAEEVRDDIPAQLSDGEYVVPADVVRYYGVKFFEDLRDQAKIGLAEMEANGRIGGEPVPAGGPMNTEELSPEEMQAIQEVMGMSNGGSVESNMLGGKTSAQVEQDMLAQGNIAMNQNYTGIPLGSTIFDPVNTNTGIQQTEVKPFTPIVLYNTAGQTRTVNSEEEKAKAMAEGYTMTLDEYNMYRSKRGGSGGSGRGSGIITPPSQEDDSKPWGEGIDWNNEDSIREFVKSAQEGNIQGASGRFLRGAGFALFGLPGALLAGAFQTGQAFETLSDMKAAELIARARGMDTLAEEIEGDINSYVEKSGQVVDLIKNVFGISTRKADRHARSLGFEDIEEYEAAFKDRKDFLGGTKIESTKGKDGKVLNVYKAGKDTKRPVPRPYQGQGPSFDDKSLGKDSATSTSAQSYTKPKNDPYAEDRFKNKGGLMTKGKKKKAKK